MPRTIRDDVNDQIAKRLGTDILHVIRAMHDRNPTPSVLAAIEWAVGTYCDDLSDRHALAMGCRLAGIDYDSVAGRTDRKAFN